MKELIAVLMLLFSVQAQALNVERSNGAFIAIDAGTYRSVQKSVQTTQTSTTQSEIDRGNTAFIPNIGYRIGNWYANLSYVRSEDTEGRSYGSDVRSIPQGVAYTNESISFSRHDSILSVHLGRTVSIFRGVHIEAELGMSAWRKAIGLKSYVVNGTLANNQTSESSSVQDLSYEEDGWSPSGKFSLVAGDETAMFHLGVRHIGGIESTIFSLGVRINFPR